MSKTWLLGAALLLSGCGKEVGRVSFSGEGSSSVETAMAAGRVAFWTDIDIAYDGPATLDYRVALVQAGSRVATAICNPLGPMSTKLVWVEAENGSAHSRAGRGKMACNATLPKGGPTTVEATLAFGVRPRRVTITRADLVVKQ
jgi:hypothetical protein